MPTPDSALIRASCSLTLAREREVASRLLVSMLRSTVEIPRIASKAFSASWLNCATPCRAVLNTPPKNPSKAPMSSFVDATPLRVASIDSPMALRWSESDLAALSEDSATACIPLAPSSPDAFSSLTLADSLVCSWLNSRALIVPSLYSRPSAVRMFWISTVVFALLIASWTCFKFSRPVLRSDTPRAAPLAVDFSSVSFALRTPAPFAYSCWLSVPAW